MLSVIVNPAAGGGRAARAVPDVSSALRRHGLEHRIEFTDSLAHARALAQTAAERDEVAVAFGGDGLLAAVAGVMAEHDGVLAVLPGGRGNDFARCIGLPLEPVAAAETLASATITRFDLGWVGDSPFIGIATCGFDSTANRIANETRLPLGNLVYAYGALRALAGWRPLRFELRADGEELTFVGYSVAIANASRYGGGMQLAPEARLDDGLFDVVLVSDAPKLSFLRQLPRVFSGAHLDSGYVRVIRAREVQVSADRHTEVYADGDPIATLPVVATVRPQAVRVMVPAR